MFQWSLKFLVVFENFSVGRQKSVREGEGGRGACILQKVSLAWQNEMDVAQHKFYTLFICRMQSLHFYIQLLGPVSDHILVLKLCKLGARL